MQKDLFTTSISGLIPLPMRDAQLRYQADFIAADLASTLYQSLLTELDWQQDSIRMFGKMVKIPRLQAWYGDPQAQYTYSGLSLTPLNWTATLSQLRQQVEIACDASFNSVLANYYRDGQDSMGWHSDDEPELGSTPVIASLTLGQTRCFLFRHKQSKKVVKIDLADGSLLVMSGETQRHWQHAIQKQTQKLAGRINLTFRNVLSDLNC